MIASPTSLSRAAVGLIVLAAVTVPRAVAQPNAAPVPVEVAPDRQVTFRLSAPGASTVSVSGDWMSQGLGTGGPMHKGEQGIWSLTVGPLPADFYSYTFTVDGVRTVDARNPLFKPGVAGLESMFEVPGAEAEFEAARNVPHGEVRAVWYHSATLDAPRRMHVYTPPGYETGGQAYPVLYLLHGSGDEDSGWSTIGRAGFILDNLIAAKKAVPMIVVMPNGSLPRPADFPRSEPGAAPSPEARAARERLQNRFMDELLKEVVPFVERHYRAGSDRAHRAIAGLSMGGGQTLRVITAHPDQFAYVGVWSAGVGRNASDFEERNRDFLDHADRVNEAVKLFSISVGDRDTGALAGSKLLAEILEKHGIKHELHVSGGGHTWINWRHYLNDFAPRLFRGEGAPSRSAPAPSAAEERLRTDWANLSRYREENAVLGPPAEGEDRVVFLGDSITDAWGRHAGKFFPGKPYVNRGISGQTTPQMLVRFRQDVIGLEPKAVVILAGTNDIAGNTGPTTLEAIEGNLTSMAELAKAEGIRVVLASVLPAFDFPWRRGLEPAPKIAALNAWIKEYADRNGLVYLDYYSAVVDDRPGLKAELSGDGVHPNDAGYALMAPLAERAIARALGR